MPNQKEILRKFYEEAALIAAVKYLYGINGIVVPRQHEFAEAKKLVEYITPYIQDLIAHTKENSDEEEPDEQ